MFNRKKIEKLEQELANKTIEINKLTYDLNTCRNRIKEITELQDKIPESCTPGSYCKSCEFAKAYEESSSMYGVTFSKTYYVCNKSGSCSEFVQKQ